MKKVLLVFGLICFVNIHAQNAPIPKEDKWAQTYYDQIIAEYGKIVALNTLHFGMNELMTDGMVEKRDRLEFSAANSNIMVLSIETFRVQTDNYVQSKFPFTPSFPGTPVGGKSNWVKVLYTRQMFSRKLMREAKYLKMFAGEKATGTTEALTLSEGDRLLLILTGMERVINFTLQTNLD